MVSKEALKLYRHLIAQNSTVLVVGAAEILGKLKNSGDFCAGADLSTLSSDRTYDCVLVILDQAGIADIQDFLLSVTRLCHAGTRIIIDWPAVWWSFLPGMRSRYAFSVVDMDRLVHLANGERVTSGNYELLPWSIPGISWFFNTFLARLPLFGFLCQRRWIVMRPLKVQKDPVTVTASVIVPCRNERGNIESAVKRIPKMGAETEIIFVEGHSGDNTLQEIERVAAAHPDKKISWCVQSGKGKGDAVREGFARARGDVLMILDADLTVQPEDLPKFFNALVEGKGECVNGSRLIYPMEPGAMQTLNWCANHFFAGLFSWLMGQRVTDTLCGTKVLWKTDYEKIAANRAYFGEFDPFGDFDLLFGAAKLQLKILDVPVHYKSRVYGSTQIRRFLHGWILLGMSLYAMRKLKFY